MPFTTESEVRLLFQLNDTEQVPSALLEACIELAHAEVMRVLDAAQDVQPPKRAVASAETFRAAAYLFQALAAQDAATQRTLVIGGQRVEPGRRFEVLNIFAQLAGNLSDRLLEPYAKPGVSRMLAGYTDSGLFEETAP